MSFDVSQLTGRAAEFKELGIEYTISGIEAGDLSGGAGYGYAEKFANQAFAGVEHIYDDFLDIPDPDAFTAATDSLKSTIGTLTLNAVDLDAAHGGFSPSANPALKGISASALALNDWTGKAALAYNENFVPMFEPVTSNQSLLASVIRHAIHAEAAVWQAVRNDLDKLSNDAIKHMKQCNDKNPSEWGAALSIAAAVIGGLTAPLTGGTSLEIAFGVVGAAFWVGGSAVPLLGQHDPEDMGLASGNPLKIRDSLQDALNRIKTHIVEAENQIVSDADKSAGAITSDYRILVQPEPSLADANQHKYNDPDYLGHPTNV